MKAKQCRVQSFQGGDQTYQTQTNNQIQLLYPFNIGDFSSLRDTTPYHVANN